MDILRKMFKLNGKEDKDSTAKDEFRKPQWFEETETDDELFDDDRKFAFQIFTNPMELQRHFERQMQQILEAVSEFEDSDIKVEKDLKGEFLKPGYEDSILKEFEKEKKKYMDTDLDGEIYADQLHSLMQRLSPDNTETPNILPRNDNKNNRKPQSKKRPSDEELIFGKLHGTIIDENEKKLNHRTMPDVIVPMMPRGATPFGGVFEGTYQGPKMFSQSVMTKTIRKPDGTTETTKVSKDSQGNQTTTVTRTINGKTETFITHDKAGGGGTTTTTLGPNNGGGASLEKKIDNMAAYSDRNMYVTKEGYAMPRNLW